MSFKVLRNAQGDAVAYGPNDDNYEPGAPAGHSVVIEPEAPEITVSPKEKLMDLDAKNPITQRNLRQFILLTVEAFKSGEPLDLSAIPGVRDVALVEAQAEVFREQVRAQS